MCARRLLSARSQLSVFAVVVIGVVAACHCDIAADDAATPAIGWGLSRWVPIPERMWTKEIAVIFAGVPTQCGSQDGKVQTQPVFIELDRVEAQHKSDKDVSVLAAYIRAMCYLQARLSLTDGASGKEAALRLSALAKQDEKRYEYFGQCGEHLLLACKILSTPEDLQNAKTSLDNLIKMNPNTNAVGISFWGFVDVMRERDGAAACEAYLQHLSETYPNTFTALYSWHWIAFIRARSEQWDQAESAARREIEVAKAMGDPRLVAFAEGALKTWQYARHHGAKN
jgi:hypothetical protein